jgi:hypothetical protein
MLLEQWQFHSPSARTKTNKQTNNIYIDLLGAPSDSISVISSHVLLLVDFLGRRLVRYIEPQSITPWTDTGSCNLVTALHQAIYAAAPQMPACKYAIKSHPNRSLFQLHYRCRYHCRSKQYLSCYCYTGLRNWFKHCGRSIVGSREIEVQGSADFHGFSRNISIDQFRLDSLRFCEFGNWICKSKQD